VRQKEEKNKEEKTKEKLRYRDIDECYFFNMTLHKKNERLISTVKTE